MDAPKTLLPLQFSALKLFGELVNLKGEPVFLQDELSPKAKNGLIAHMLRLVIAAGGM